MTEYREGYDIGFIDGYKNHNGDVIGESDDYIHGYNEGWDDGYEEKRNEMLLDR